METTPATGSEVVAEKMENSLGIPKAIFLVNNNTKPIIKKQ
jgi:hypothetical protein